MTKQVTVTFNDWVLDQIIGNPINKSKKIEELVIKGFMSEQGIKLNEK